MITIESAQKDLFCFAASLMLAYKKTGYETKYFLGITYIPHGNVYFTDYFELITCPGRDGYCTQFYRVGFEGNHVFILMKSKHWNGFGNVSDRRNGYCCNGQGGLCKCKISRCVGHGQRFPGN